MINVGQIYSYKKIGNFVITSITEEKISRIWQDGSVDEIDINVYDGRMFGVLIAEFGSWQEAVCSNDFKEINGDQYEKIKELEKRLENLTNNYKLLEKKQAIDIADGQALVDEFGDFESVYKELQRLREESKQMFDLLEMVARGITLNCDTEDVIRITSAVKRFCISKRESEGK